MARIFKAHQIGARKALLSDETSRIISMVYGAGHTGNYAQFLIVERIDQEFQRQLDEQWQALDEANDEAIATAKAEGKADALQEILEECFMPLDTDLTALFEKLTAKTKTPKAELVEDIESLKEFLEKFAKALNPE